jgi:hypothetical protein
MLSSGRSFRRFVAHRFRMYMDRAGRDRAVPQVPLDLMHGLLASAGRYRWCGVPLWWEVSQRQPFTAPAVSPPTKSFCMAKKRIATGKVMITDAAITAPQSVLNSVENSASPIGRVLTR